MAASARAGVGESIQAQIAEVMAECGVDGWNGEASSAGVQEAAAQHAGRFVSMMEVNRFPPPTVIPEADGDLALEWHRDEHRWLIASFPPDGHVNFACRLKEGNKATGTCSISPEFAHIIDGYLTILFAE